MIDNKKIGKAAIKYAEETWDHEEDQFLCINGFYAGAEWAQKEFVESLWHDASEEPKEYRGILIEMSHGRAVLYVIERKRGVWEEAVKTCGYIRWCYLNDILPSVGGERSK